MRKSPVFENEHRRPAISTEARRKELNALFKSHSCNTYLPDRSRLGVTMGCYRRIGLWA